MLCIFSQSFDSFQICTVLSIQYVKLVVLLGLALPVSGVLVSDTPLSFEVSLLPSSTPAFPPISLAPTIRRNLGLLLLQAFYLYLYLVSLLFMMYVYFASAWRHRRKVTVKRTRGKAVEYIGRGRVVALL